jgi:hypothetical protein
MPALCSGLSLRSSPEHSASPPLYLAQQPATDGPELTATSGPRLLAKLSNRAVYDPTVSAPGPHALLAKKDLVEKYLAEQGLSLVWTVLGGKQYMERDPKEWKGEMQINGAYRLADGNVKGNVRGRYRTT